MTRGLSTGSLCPVVSRSICLRSDSSATISTPASRCARAKARTGVSRGVASTRPDRCTAANAVRSTVRTSDEGSADMNRWVRKTWTVHASALLSPHSRSPHRLLQPRFDPLQLHPRADRACDVARPLEVHPRLRWLRFTLGDVGQHAQALDLAPAVLRHAEVPERLRRHGKR